MCYTHREATMKIHRIKVSLINIGLWSDSRIQILARVDNIYLFYIYICQSFPICFEYYNSMQEVKLRQNKKNVRLAITKAIKHGSKLNDIIQITYT